MREFIRGVPAVLAMLALLLVSSAPMAQQARDQESSWDEARIKARRDVVDAMEAETLATVLDRSAEAKLLFDRSYGYAVFNNTKVTFVLSGGGGRGVAVERAGNRRVYMKMGTGGVGLGLGAQRYQVVFLFETEQRFTSFIERGWQAGASASAMAGRKGGGAETNFVNGIAVYQISEKGLVLQADVAGTKYWRDKKLN